MNTWVTIERTFAGIKVRGKEINRRVRPFRRRIALFLAVVADSASGNIEAGR